MKKIIFRSSKFFLSTLYFILCTFFSFSQPVTFSYTGAAQTYTVGACITSITVDAKGAEGSTPNSSVALAGKGGRVQAILPVTPGEILNIYVGGAGTNVAGGWNGGGNPGAGSGAGGGGASDIRQGGTALTNRIVVASGGGGAGAVWSTNCHGGNGGGLTGLNGIYASSYDPMWCGSGGTQTAGGIAASTNGSQPGTSGFGGTGGTQGGGGGGGYYGGGGGSYGGGGGGSSYAIGAASGVVHTAGFQTGDGQITVTPNVSTGPSTPGTINGYSFVCPGTATSYSISAVTGAATYSWTVPSGSTINSGGATTVINVTFGSSSGNISVTASNSCGTSAASILSVTVAANLPASAGNDVTICTNGNTQLNAGGGSIYSWVPSSGLSDPNISNPVAAPAVTTTYTVYVSDVNGCTGADEVTVFVDPCTGVFQFNETMDVIVSPNPSSGIFSVSVSNIKSDEVKLIVLDIRGEIIYNVVQHVRREKVFSTGIDIKKVSPGIYFLRIVSDSGSNIYKIMKR